MKKLSVLFVALAVAASASAAGQFKSSVRSINKYQIKKESVLSKKDIAHAKKSPSRVITEQPEGTAYDFQRTGGGTYASSGSLYLGDQAGTKARFVFDADGTTVYVRDLLYNSANSFGHSWVQGTIEGNTLTIPLGQSIYWSEQYQADVLLCWGTTSASGENQIAFTRDESVTAVTYTIDAENQTYTLNGTVAPESTDASDINAYLGTGLSAYWADDNSWTGCIEWSTVFSNPAEPAVAPTMITEQPEGELFTYLRSGDCIYNSFFGLGTTPVEGKMKVVFNDETGKAYILNPLWWLDGSNTWVEGDFDAMTGVITVPVGQYLSWYEDSEYGVQLMWGSTYVYQDVDENGETGYYLGTELDTEAEYIYFQVDGDKIMLLNSEGDATLEFPENYNATGLYAMYSDDQSWAGALEFGVNAQILNVVPAVPADPIIDTENEVWRDGGDESGYSRFYFTLPTTDIDGNPIDPELLSYSIYTDDDQIFTFEAATYTHDLEEDMTEIPFSIYSGGYDFYSNGCYFYRTNAEGFEPFFQNRIGVQAIYTVDVPEVEGAPAKAPVVNKSNIVYYELTYDAIESVKAELDVNAPVYNVMGQKMNSKNLPAGIYIQNGRKFVIR